MGWKHETVITKTPAPVPENHIKTATETALPLLAERLAKHAVLFSGDVRLQALRGLIHAGMKSVGDVNAVIKTMLDKGVSQNARKTRMYCTPPDQHGQVRVTTTLHLDQEEELIDLARRAANDRSRVLTAADLAEAETRLGMDLSNDQGEKQRRAAIAMATGGAFGVFIGAAGSGKTSGVLPQLVAAWKARGYTVWGTVLAWRQANALEETGIASLNCRALQPLLDGIRDGRTRLDRTHVVVIDIERAVDTTGAKVTKCAPAYAAGYGFDTGGIKPRNQFL